MHKRRHARLACALAADSRHDGGMKTLGALLVVGAIVLTPASATAAASSDSPSETVTALALDSPYAGRYIEEYTAQYYINTDGTVDVTIDFTFNFNGISGHGPYVSYPIRVPYNDQNDRFYRISNVHASSPTGAPADINREADKYWVNFKIGDPDIGTINGVQQYHLTYTVDGLLNLTTRRSLQRMTPRYGTSSTSTSSGTRGKFRSTT